MTTNTNEALHAKIREAGGIVHRDGNIFFTNAEQFLRVARTSATSDAAELAAQQTDYEFNLRGFLASKLICWHRLTEAEAQNIVQVFEAATPPQEVYDEQTLRA